MPEKDAETYRLNPFDVTKVWNFKDYPRMPIGEFVLNRNPENYFADVEQAAFAPSSIIPGLGYSPDRMLQGRIFAYADAHRYRLGINHHQIPVNKPIAQVTTYHRDGYGRVDGNGGAGPNYHPNSFDGVEADKSYEIPPFMGTGAVARYDHREDGDYYSQPGDLFRLMNDEQKKLLASNIAGAMNGVPKFIQDRQIEHFTKADPNYGKMVKDLLK